MTSKTFAFRKSAKPKMTRWDASGSSFTDINMIPSIIAGWDLAKEGAVELGAKMTKQAIDDTFTRQGDPIPWRENKPSTVERKGAGKRILENSGALAGAVEVKRITGAEVAGMTARGIGWFDDLHPYAQLDDGFGGRPLTFGELAWIHELGMVSFEETSFGEEVVATPSRPWASQAADREGPEIVGAEVAYLDAFLMANSIGGKAGIVVGLPIDVDLG